MAQAELRVPDERGDVPGWVLVTLMTAGLVVLIWAVAGPALTALFKRLPQVGFAVSFRWTTTSLRMFQAAAFPRLPFYDTRMADFFSSRLLRWLTAPARSRA